VYMDGIAIMASFYVSSSPDEDAKKANDIHIRLCPFWVHAHLVRSTHQDLVRETARIGTATRVVY
jgi:hypothetical protein